MEDRGLLGKIIAIIPGLALMVGTLAVLRMYVVPWLGGITLFGIKGWPVQVLSLNYILLSIIAGMLFRNVLFGGQIPAWAFAQLVCSSKQALLCWVPCIPFKAFSSSASAPRC